MQGKIKGFLAAALFFSMMLFAFWSIGKTIDQSSFPAGRSDRHKIAETRMYCDVDQTTPSFPTTTTTMVRPGTIRATWPAIF
jgi:hypothetical protein